MKVVSDSIFDASMRYAYWRVGTKNLDENSDYRKFCAHADFALVCGMTIFGLAFSGALACLHHAAFAMFGKPFKAHSIDYWIVVTALSAAVTVWVSRNHWRNLYLDLVAPVDEVTA